jgi:hypothetical protein
MLLRSTTAPLRSHEMSQIAGIAGELEPGDITSARKILTD